MRRGKAEGVQAGQAMVEFAGVATILFLLVFAILEFGRGFFYYNTVVSAAQEGARYGATDQHVGCVQAAALAKAVAIDLTSGNVNVTFPDGSALYGNRISVVVNYTFAPVISFIPGFPVQGNGIMRIARTYNSGGSCL